jgi:glycosyltransferase involved in cell wall biosynthesis
MYWLKAAKLRHWTLRRALDTCDAVVALSRHAEDTFERSLGARVRTIAPGVDLAAFRRVAARAQRPTIVCSAAVDVPRKNVALLTAAFERIRDRHPDARLVLSRPRNDQAARRAGIDLGAPGVEWADLDDRDALARAYSEAWVGVLPAVEEAFGLVLIEALACGTPVVGFAHAGIPEVIDSRGVGRLFERPDPELLAGAILEAFELAADPQAEARCRARAEHFSIDRCTDRYQDLYRELLDARSYNASRGLRATAL